MEEKKIKEKIVLKGKYISTVGKRKTSTARIRLYKNGKGIIIVNNKKVNEYFTNNIANIVRQPIKLTGHLRDMDFSIFGPTIVLHTAVAAASAKAALSATMVTESASPKLTVRSVFPVLVPMPKGESLLVIRNPILPDKVDSLVKIDIKMFLLLVKADISPPSSTTATLASILSSVSSPRSAIAPATEAMGPTPAVFEALIIL